MARCSLLFMLIFLVHVISSTPIPAPSLTSMLGEKPLCIGEDVTFTCTVIGAGRLKWVIGSVNNVIVFGLEENSVSLNNSRQDSSGNFAALLTSYSRSESSSFLGNLTSTLHVHVDAEMYLPGVIGCENGLTDVSTLKLSIADPPSPPLNVMVTAVYGIAEYSVRVQWQSPSDDGGVGIDYYTLTIFSEGIKLATITTVSKVEDIYPLNYSTNYSVIVTASNCAGFGSSSSSGVLLESGCGRPSDPVNGSIEKYMSTEEGAVIQFHCDGNYTPSQWNASQCHNLTWSPDPQTLYCAPGSTIIGCVASISAAVTITTTSGSSATYQCSDGSSGVYTTQCTSDGVWEPDPNTLECGEPVVCELIEKNNLVFKYNDRVEGSIMTITCVEGYFLPYGDVEFLCTSDGSWSPDPMDYACIPQVMLKPMTAEVLQTGVVVTIIIVVVVILISITTVVVIIFLRGRKAARLKRRFQLRGNNYVETPTPVLSPFTCTQRSVIQREPEESGTELIGQSSAVQDMVSGGASPGTSPAQPPPPPPHSAVRPPVKNLVYAEVDPHVSSTPRPPNLQTEKVQYASLWHNAIVEPLPSELKHPADCNVNLDQILIQLQEVVPHWRRLAEVVGIEDLEKITEHVKGDGEAMVEIVDGWLAKLYPKVPTWREIADVVEHIGHDNLSYAINQVYITGFLPIEVSNAVPNTHALLNAVPPPLPPCCDTDQSATHHSLHHDSSDEQPPPIPVKASRMMFSRHRLTNEEK